MELYEIESNGDNFVFNVVKNTTKPCFCCGVAACRKEDILWYEENNKRISFIFDGGLFNMALEATLKKTLKLVNIESLPNFMKEWSLCSGWEYCWDYNGHSIEIDDFIKSLNLLKTEAVEKWFSNENIALMEKLAKDAKMKGLGLKIVRG